MTYSKERYAKAKLALQFAEDGFKNFVKLIGDAIKECNNNDLPGLVEELSLACEVMEDLRDDLERAEDMIKEDE